MGSPRRALLTLIVVALGASVIYSLSPPVREVAAWLTVPALFMYGLVQLFPNETKQRVGWALGHVAWLGNSVERESVRQDVEGTLSLGLANLVRASPSSSSGRLRLEFIKSGEQISELPDGTVVVGITQHEDRTRNLVAAAWAYARNAVLPLARVHLDPDVSVGVDFSVAKAILSKADVLAVGAFIREYWQKVVGDSARLKVLVHKLELVEDDELLGPVLLEEFAELGLRRATRLPDEDAQAETAAFVEHLADLAVREPGSGSETHFNGRHMRCGFVLAGTAGLASSKGAGASRDAIDWAIRNAYPRIYVMAKGHNLRLAREACAEFVGDRRVLSVREFLSTVPNVRGDGRVDRLVAQIKVDVRHFVGIGTEPVVAVGRSFEEVAASRRRR
jgi:hypothetical protein